MSRVSVNGVNAIQALVLGSLLLIVAIVTPIAAQKEQQSEQINNTNEVTTEVVEEVQIDNESPQEEIQVETTDQPAEESWDSLTNAEKVLRNPNGCDLTTQVMWEDGTCHDMPTQAAVTQSTPQAVPRGSGSCEAEIHKYDWNIATATAVMRAESGGNTNALNDNPRTGDYSVGCFQINIIGANARNRPSEAQLRNASTNVAFAYKIYVGNGKSFIGQWGVCRKISCY